MAKVLNKILRERAQRDALYRLPLPPLEEDPRTKTNSLGWYSQMHMQQRYRPEPVIFLHPADYQAALDADIVLSVTEREEPENDEGA